MRARRGHNPTTELPADKNQKFFWPAFKCERNNVFVGPLGYYDTREDAEANLNGPGGLTGILLGFEPYKVLELSYAELDQEHVIPTQMQGAPAWVIEGPLTEQYRNRRARIG